MQAELEALEKGLGQPKRPVIAIVGGAKVSSKIELLEKPHPQGRGAVIGGAMANTFVHALGMGVGKSLCEKRTSPTSPTPSCKRPKPPAAPSSCPSTAPLPGIRGCRAASLLRHGRHRPDGMSLDVGPGSIERIKGAIDEAGTLGLERSARRLRDEPPSTTVPPRSHRYVAARTKAGKWFRSPVAGDTVAALAKAGVKDNLTYIRLHRRRRLPRMDGRQALPRRGPQGRAELRPYSM